MKNISVLIVDDDEIEREILRSFFEQKKYNIFEASCDDDAFEILSKNEINITILDIILPGKSGLEILKIIKDKYPDIITIMITADNKSENVLNSLRRGAFDFFQKPIDFLQLETALNRSLKYIDLQDKYIEKNYLSSHLTDEINSIIGTEIIGNGKEIQNIKELIIKAGESPDTSVLITGASGVGKEKAARAIHNISDRKKHYFFPLNCSAIPEQLIESELFGHKKGSFTGAIDDKEGCFEAADKGTLFLDEIGDMPYNLQIKLLRVLEDHKIKRIGSNKEIEVDVRIISATNKDIESMVEKNEFRLDLFHRLNTLQIDIPPLKDRIDDIPELFSYFLKYFIERLNKKIGYIDPLILEKLRNYSFPGNIRELKNMIERAVILCESGKLTINEFLCADNKSNRALNQTKNNLDELAKTAIEDAMIKAGNNKSQAAKILNISRFALLRKLKKYNI